MKILICGFMGSGKSTFLKKLESNKLGLDCIDLDHAVALDLGIHSDRLGNWIIENGFPLFRDKEQTKLKNLLDHPQSMVIALGGGTLTPSVQALIEKNADCKMVFLDTPLEVCLERIKSDPNRPLSKISRDDLVKLYETRKEIYLKSDLILNEAEIKEIVSLSALVHNLFLCEPKNR